MENFAIITYKSGNNYIIVAEGTEEELLSIIECIKESMKDKELKVVKLDKEDYEENKKNIIELNKLIDNNF